MASRIKVDVPNWNDKSTKLRDQVEKQLSKEILRGKTEISTRTAQGRDVNDQPFIPYSKLYAAEREAKGRKSSPVDLTFTGTMLRSMQTRLEATAEGVAGLIFFLAGRPDGLNNAEIAAKLQSGDFGFKKKKPRKFFALSEKLTREIISNIRKALKL